MKQPVDDSEKCVVLYIDDEEKSLKYFTRAFQDKFRVLSAANATEGYRLLEQYRDEVALLIVDQRMPGEKGLEFLQRARELHPQAVRILTTAYSDFDVMVDAINSQAIYKYVTKPWDIPELETILTSAYEVFTAQRESDLFKDEMSTQQGSEQAAQFTNLQTPEQVARYLNVNKFTIYRLVTQKKIPGFKVGNQWRFKQDMIDEWLMSKLNVRRKKTE